MKKLFSMIAAALLALFGLSAQAQELTVRFFDMGKADAMLITTPSGEQILIDAGTNKGGKKLAERFAKDGVDAIDLMIITHFDKDHVGGADKVLESVPVARVVMPEYAKESKQHTQFMDALSQSPKTQVDILSAKGEKTFEFGDIALRITAAQETDYGIDEENDFSLAAYLTYGETKFLFTGDAEDARQTELLRAGRYRLRRAEGSVSRAGGGCECGVFKRLPSENCVHHRQRRRPCRPDCREAA